MSTRSVSTRILLRVVGLAMLAMSLWAGVGEVSYVYDRAGRLVKANYPAGKAIIYTYDSAGNLKFRKVFVPCFSWQSFTSHLVQWPQPQTVLTLIDDIECTSQNNKLSTDSIEQDPKRSRAARPPRPHMPRASGQ